MQNWRSELLGQELDPTYQDLRAQNPDISVPKTREIPSASRAPVFESKDSFDAFPRRMTMKSAKALDKIQLLEAELAGFVKDLQAKFKQVRSHLATPKELYKIKSQIAQFSGVLEKFQYVKVSEQFTGRREASNLHLPPAGGFDHNCGSHDGKGRGKDASEEDEQTVRCVEVR